MRNFVVFFELNSRFVINEEGETAEAVIKHVSDQFGIAEKFLEVIEKKLKKAS